MSSHTVQTLKNGLKVLTGQIGINIFSLGFGIYFAHVLALDEMAILAILFLVGGIFPVISSLGINDTLMKKIPGLIEEGKDHRVNEFFMSAIYIQIVIVVLLLCLSLVFHSWISTLFYKSVLPFNTMLIIILYAMTQSFILLMNAMIRAVQNFGQLSIIKIIEQISSRIFSIALFFVWHVNGLLLGLLLGSMVGFFMYCYYLRGYFKKLKPLFHQSKELIQYSFPYYCAAWLRFSIMYADRYFVSIFFHPEQLAIYHVANKITGYVITAMDAIANPITSKIAQLKIYGRERMESIYNKVFRYYSLLYIPLIGLIIAFARPIIELYGGTKYSDGAPILMILAAGLMLAPFSGLIETYVFILGKPIERLKIRFFSGIFSLLGAYVLMKMIGVNGLALSKLFVWGIYIVIGVILLKKFITVTIDKKTLYKTVGLCLPFVAGGVFIQYFLYSHIMVALYFLIFSLMLVFFYVNVLKRERGLWEELIPKKS